MANFALIELSERVLGLHQQPQEDLKVAANKSRTAAAHRDIHAHRCTVHSSSNSHLAQKVAGAPSELHWTPFEGLQAAIGSSSDPAQADRISWNTSLQSSNLGLTSLRLRHFRNKCSLRCGLSDAVESVYIV